MKTRILFLAAAAFMIFNPGAATKAQAEVSDCDDCINSVIDLCSNIIDDNQWALCINVGLANCVYLQMCPASVIGG